MPTVKSYQKQKEKEKIAYDYFVSQGYSPEASAGIVGNLVYESGLDTSAEGDIGYKGGNSYGAAQWRGQRLTNLKKRYGDKWTDFNNQLDFVRHELETTHAKAGNLLKGTVDVHKAGEIFSDFYEIPAKKYKDNKDRQTKVAGVYNSIVGQSITPELTQLQISAPITNFVEAPVKLTQEPPKESAEVIKAKESLSQQTNEFNFLNDFLNNELKIPQQTIAAPQQQAQSSTPSNILESYNKISNLVTTPAFQNGGTFEQDREWLQNWYENRVIPNPEIQDIYLQDKPSFTALSEFIPNPIMRDVIDNDPEIVGSYDPMFNTIELTKDAPATTYLHEAVHRTQNFEGQMGDVHKKAVQDYILPKDKVYAYQNKEYDYFTRPNEVHARIQVLRNRAGIAPDQNVTPEFLQNFLKNYQGDDENINDLLKLTDEQGLLNLLNTMAARTDNRNIFYGQQGGVINSQQAYNPALANNSEFLAWYKNNTIEGQNNIPYSDQLDYDYLSFFMNGNNLNPNYNTINHFPDTYKKPNHETFSNESIYSIPENPGGYWNQEIFNRNGQFKYQQGGQIPVSSRGMYEYPNQKVIVPTNGAITMKNINHNILAKSLETGEQKILRPGLEYFFNNTQNVLEIPLK